MEEQNPVQHILELIEKLESGDFTARGKIFDDSNDLNDIVLALNRLASKLNNLYETGKTFEGKINEVIDLIVAYASLDFSKEIKVASRNNILFPITTGLKILGKQLSEFTIEKNYFEAVLMAQPDMLVIINADGIIETINTKTLEILGYSEKELLGKHIRIIFRDEFILFQGSLREKILNKGVLSNLDKFYITKDKRKIPVSFSASVIMSRNRTIKGYICIAHDMTEYKRNEKILNLRMKELAEARSAALNMMEDAYEANKSKTVFLTNMSHELRTPMSAIIGISQIISQSRSENLTEEQKEGIEIINQSGKRLLTLINDILDLSKVEVGKMEVLYSKFSLSHMIYNMEKITKNLVASKPIEVVTRTDSMVPDMIISDEKKLNQILINILGNAAKFTERGHIKLKTFLKNEELHFEIEDTGIGIKSDEVQYIFDEFKQLDGSMSRKYEGTGLGLSLCKKMINLLNGKISAESEYRVGTKIHFSIPFIMNDEILKNQSKKQEEAVNGAEEIAATGAKDKPVILIADDEAICQFTIKIMLKQQYKLEFAKTGKEAIEKYFSCNPKLVLMDIMMPEINGYKAFTEIRDRDKSGNIPIIAVTARAMEEDKQKILQFGFNDYISKPFDVKILQRMIKKFIED